MISVVIPVRNRKENLKNTINYVLNQTYTNIEIIVVDYGGDDDVEQMLEDYWNHRVKYFYVNEKGIWNLSRARNVGIRRANGDLVVSLDADMLLEADVLERIYADFKAREHPVLYQIHRREMLADGTIKLYPPALTGIVGGVGAFPGCFQACSKACWLKVRGFDERLCGYGYEDGDLIVRMARIGVKQHWMPLDVKAYHQYHPESPGLETYVNMIKSKLNRDYKANDEGWGSIKKKGDAPRYLDKFLIAVIVKPIKLIKRWIRRLK